MAQAGIHRPDRSPLVRVLALQGDYFRDERSEIFPFLEDYSRQKGLQFRHGLYTGSGWDVDDYARVMHQGGEDFGEQLSSYMVSACAELGRSASCCCRMSVGLQARCPKPYFTVLVLRHIVSIPWFQTLRLPEVPSKHR